MICKHNFTYVCGIIGLLIILVSGTNPAVSLISGFFVAYLSTRIRDTDEEISTGNSVIGRLLMGWAIVSYGATINLTTIYNISFQYLWVTVSGIFLVILTAWQVGRILGVDSALRSLIGIGTAICGASAIAALGSAIKAPAEKMSSALAVILIFNAIALILFPYLGHLLDLPPDIFAAWAGLAIHDTSSVVGAAIAYDAHTVEIATTVKLARSIWISPVTIVLSSILLSLGDATTSKIKLNLPWFIWGYLLSATFTTFSPAISLEYSSLISFIAKNLFCLGLFFTGSAVNIKALQALGIQPFILGLIVWIISACWSLLLI